MSTVELALWVVGVVGLLRKASPRLDGWSVVTALFVVSASLVGARLAFDGVPTGVAFGVLVRAGAVAGVGAGLVILADRVGSHLHGRTALRPFLPTSPAPAATEEEAPPPALLHRATLVALMLFLVFACLGAYVTAPDAPRTW